MVKTNTKWETGGNADGENVRRNLNFYQRNIAEENIVI